MKKESTLYGIIGLLAGVVITGFTAAYAVNNNHGGMMRTMGMHTNSSTNTNTNTSTNHMGMSMDSMSTALQGKTGDDFDKTFISEMIDHHQGAIDMANLAKQNAKHEEIKKLADDIVTAQTKEISEMKTWQRQWGYGGSSDSSNDMMDMMGH